jgi:hypothetical protein
MPHIPILPQPNYTIHRSQAPRTNRALTQTGYFLEAEGRTGSVTKIIIYPGKVLEEDVRKEQVQDSPESQQ